MFKNKNLVVAKANDFIQNSFYPLNETEQKCLIYILSLLPNPKTLDELPLIEFEMVDLKRVLGLRKEDKNDGYYKNVLKGLMEPRVWVRLKDDRGEYATPFSWIDPNEFRYYFRDGHISLKLNNKLKPFLSQLKVYTEYEIRYIMNMKGAYSTALYELLKSWSTAKVKEFEVEYLRDKLDATTSSYNNFNNFRKKVLEPSISEINKHTDLDVSYIEKAKRGRKILTLEFQIKIKNIESIKNDKNADYRAALDFIESISNEEIELIINMASEIMQNDELINYFKRKNLQLKAYDKPIKSKVGFLKTLIEADIKKFKEDAPEEEMPKWFENKEKQTTITPQVNFDEFIIIYNHYLESGKLEEAQKKKEEFQALYGEDIDAIIELQELMKEI